MRQKMKKTFMLMAALFLWVTACETPSVPKMSKEELKAMLGDPSLVVVDVRSAADWNAEERKIKGSLRVDPSLADSLMKTYSKGKTFVFYCA